MWLDRVSNPRPLALESDALPTALRGPDRDKNCRIASYVYKFNPITTQSISQFCIFKVYNNFIPCFIDFKSVIKSKNYNIRR